MNIKAIETTYKGYRFRSRLEARWAVFLDEVGATWEYEPQGYVMGNGVTYLPDFRITHNAHDVEREKVYSWIEIKPNTEIYPDDREKVLSFFCAKREPIIIFRGEPYEYFSGNIIAQVEQRAVMPLLTNSALDLITNGSAFSHPTYLEHLLFAGVIGPELAIKIMRMNQEEHNSIGFVEVMKHLVAADLAAIKARSARFEHGEKG